MPGPEYRRQRLLRAAELLRAAKIATLSDLAISHWVEIGRRHVLEVLNLDTKHSTQAEFVSPLDVPSYAEFVEAVMTRCRV